MTDAHSPGDTPARRYPGRPRIRGVQATTTLPLDGGWELCATQPGSVTSPDALGAVSWSPAIVPGTVAMATRPGAIDDLDLERAPNYDALDWWYRCRFAGAPAGSSERVVLCFDGLASLADVWLNGSKILTSENMFVGSEADVSVSLGESNDLVIHFRSVTAALGARRPRPRWRTKLVEHQQLRWIRTTLLGRIPGWSPPVRAVGPWRGIRVERRARFDIVAGDVYPVVSKDGASVQASLTLRALEGTSIRGALLRVGDTTAPLAVASSGMDIQVNGVMPMPRAELWWPHTHGAQPRYDASVILATDDGDLDIDIGKIAFRRVELDESQRGFALDINGQRVFCRGACWTTPNVVALDAPVNAYRALLELARDAGMNMLRIGGTMVYESDCFYDLCDELGMMVWQDFMFANMDYPAGDSGFAANVGREAESVLARLRRHPSVVLWCGNSEVEQQAAMLGLDESLWSNDIFRSVLPAACAASVPGVPYWPASPSGGSLPFHADVGVAHYYGVGAYLRPLEDARRSNVRFTSECLGFSHVPDARAVERLLPNGESPFHHPRWKTRVPRDHGTGWDFEDVRDHYLAELFAVDPMRLRYVEMERYLALSRVVTGEVMARTIGEWRRQGSTCNGALVWFLQDLWLGAGWGVIDSAGRPKAAYYALKRAMQPVAAAITDEGANGLRVHLVNDRATPIDARINLVLLRGKSTVVADVAAPVQLPARGGTALSVDALLGRFYDSGYAYRFGPPGHDVVAAVLRDAAGEVIGEAFHFPAGMPAGRGDESPVTAEARPRDDSSVEITVRAQAFAPFIAIDAGDHLVDDNYFHMLPGATRTIVARCAAKNARFDGFIHALNAQEAARIGVTELERQ